MSGNRWRVLAATAVLFAAPAAATVPPESVSVGYVVVKDLTTSQSALATMNLANGDIREIAPIAYRVAALAFADSGDLYGIDPDLDRLLRLDPADGGVEEVGGLGVDIEPLPQPDLTAGADGELWMSATVAGARGLYLIDQGTGDAHWLMTLETPYAGAVAADADRLFVADYGLGTVDEAAGEVLPIGDDVLVVFQPQSMAFDANETLWAVAVCGICMTPWDRIGLITIDTESGEITLRTLDWTPLKITGFALTRRAVRTRARSDLR